VEEVGDRGLCEGSTEEHRGPDIRLFPPIEVAIAIPARAGQVLADLRVVVAHHAASGPLAFADETVEQFLQLAGRGEVVQVEQGSAIQNGVADLDYTT